MIRSKPASYWIERMGGARIACGYVYMYDQVFHDPQVIRNKMLQEIEHPTVGIQETIGIPIRLEDTPGKIRRPAPLLGQHSREILRELGYNDLEIESFIRQGIVIQPSVMESKNE